MKLLNPSIPDPQNPLDAMDLFIQAVEAVSEYDYGDCMRQWNHDLLYLQDHLKNTTPWARSEVRRIQEYVQFTPNWDVESTRDRLLGDARLLKEHLIMTENSGRAA